MAKHPIADYKGIVKKNHDLVDGVVDNGEDYEKWDSTQGTVSFSSDGITLTSDGSFSNAQMSNEHFEPSTDYLAVAIVEVNESAATDNPLVRNLGFTSTPQINFPPLTTGEIKATFTTLAVMTNPCWAFNYNLGVPGTDIKYKVKFYKVSDLADPGNPLTSALPTSGAIEIGNSAILSDQYNERYINDKNEITHIAGVNKLMPFADMADLTPASNPQMIFNIDEDLLQFYKEPLLDGSDCLDKAIKLANFNTTAFAIDSEGAYAVDTDGYFVEEVE